ncbi:hypothetical protein V7S76_01030 [Aquirufa sp. ROCK2-A2]
MSNTKEKRDQLEAQAHAYQQELSDKVEELKETAKVRGGQILMVGGILAGSYLLYSLFSGKESKPKKDSTEKESSFIGSAITSYAIAFALSLAKDKLMEYLNSLEKQEETKEEVEVLGNR